MTGGALIVDVVSIVVAKNYVVDHPFDPRCRLSTGTARDVTHAAGPRVLDLAVILSKPWTNCNTHRVTRWCSGQGVGLVIKRSPVRLFCRVA